jgi:hypothetical protein
VRSEHKKRWKAEKKKAKFMGANLHRCDVLQDAYRGAVQSPSRGEFIFNLSLVWHARALHVSLSAGITSRVSCAVIDSG